MNRKLIASEKQRLGSWGKTHPERTRILLKYSGEKILELGCCEGALVNFLYSQGYSVCGLDILPSTQWQPAPKKYFVGADARHLPFLSEEFDTVVAFEVLEHLAEPREALQEMKRVARKNLILSTPDAELHPFLRESGLAFFPWVDRSHLSFFTENSLRALIRESGLKIRLFTKINPVFPERILLESLGLPAAIVRFLGKFLRCLPRQKKFRMTFLVVAEKNSEET